MDCDAEFNALVSMYQSVVHDMKLTYPAWENVAQKALKLATQLKSTLICMNAFIDAVQTVGDAANNLKGATRDIGACLTRVCMRQRSIENRLRSFVDSLTDELAMSLQNKGSQWKQRIVEMDRHANKFCRKVRSRKGGVDVSAVNEQRRICHALLTEQWNQTSFFVASFLPVLNSQLGLFDESAHVRQVTDHLHSAVRSSKSTSTIDTILNDIHQGSDHSWRSCLSTNASRSSCIYNGDNLSMRVPSPTPSTCTWPVAVDSFVSSAGSSSIRAHTISVVEQPRRTVVNTQTYTPPSPSQPFTFALKKPPLPKRTVSSSSSTVPTIPDFNGLIGGDQVFHQNGSLLSCSSTGMLGDTTIRRSSRPLSFACEDIVTTRPNEAVAKADNGDHMNDGTSDANGQGKVNASLIAETIEQIDKLGSELDSYCNMTQSAITHQAIRFRSGSCKPPPPPERRNSTITAATPTAPSVAELRAAGGTTGSSDYASSIASSNERNVSFKSMEDFEIGERIKQDLNF